MKLSEYWRSVKVESLANGDLLIHPVYRQRPVEPGAPAVGVITRMSLAHKVEKVLRKLCG